VKLEGDQAERFRWTLGSVSSALGRCLGSVGINTLVGQIQNALIEQGYVTSRVLAPPQDLLAPADVIGKYPVVGRPDGLFVSTPDYIGNLLKKTGGNNDLIKYELGIEPQYWNGPLIRIDISNPLQQTARLPSGLEGGANSLFIRGGFMPSGAPEIVIDPVPTSSVTKIPVKKRWK
jgi:hypothetical protein